MGNTTRYTGYYITPKVMSDNDDGPGYLFDLVKDLMKNHKLEGGDGDAR